MPRPPSAAVYMAGLVLASAAATAAAAALLRGVLANGALLSGSSMLSARSSGPGTGHVERISSHYARSWGPSRTSLPPPPGPRRHELPEAFAVLLFPPRGGRTMWTYATCGMSQPGDARPLELHLFSREPARELAELLTVVAHFYRTGSALAVGHTIHFGRPWLAHSACDHGLVSLPYLDGPDLENLRLPDGQTVQFDWLIPITPEEARFKKTHGIDALEERMEGATFDYLDPLRPSVC